MPRRGAPGWGEEFFFLDLRQVRAKRYLGEKKIPYDLDNQGTMVIMT